jgi:DNA-binding winged helix-turn-helix (wHTH) protein
VNEAPDQRFLWFGKFRLDTRTGELSREGLLVKLAPQPTKLLLLLARSPGDDPCIVETWL